METQNLYEILELDPSASATIREVKANYYRLARKLHPDRVDDSEKNEANQKFNMLHQAYLILSNYETKQMYDNGETKKLFTNTTVVGKWEPFFKPINEGDVERAKNAYQGSATEEKDVIREFIIGNGSVIHLYNNIPFMRFDDEQRIILLIQDCMSRGKIPKIPIRKMRFAK